MDTSEQRNLLVTALMRPGYGETAEEILETCRMVAEAEQKINKNELDEIRKDGQISEQAWKRLVSIGKNETLWLMRHKLPANKSSLYRLNLLEPVNIIMGVRNGSIHPGTTTRDIEALNRRLRIDSRYRLSGRQILLFENSRLEDQEFNDLLEEINKIAREYDCCFDTENLENIRKRDDRYQYDKRMSDIRCLLRQDIDGLQVIEALCDDIEEDEERDAALDDLINSSFKDFVSSLMSISISRESMMKDFGFLYCVKMAHEYWRTSSRSQRYNYKRRLIEVKRRYPELEEDVEYVLDKFMNHG